MAMRKVMLLLAAMAAAVLMATGVGVADTPSDTLDANTLSAPLDGGGMGFNSSTGFNVAQTFTAEHDGQVTYAQANLWFASSGTIKENVLLQLVSVDSSGKPTTDVLASGTVPAANMTPIPTTQTVQFSNPATVQAGTKYALKASAPGGFRSVSNAWSLTNGDVYPGGEAFRVSSSDLNNIQPVTGFDLVFAIYVATTPPCTIGEIESPVNDVSSADDEGMSAYKYGSRGVIPAKFKAACDNDPIDTQEDADAHPMNLKLTKLGSTPADDVVVENTVTGSANTGDLFRFDDDNDHYIYNIGVKGLDAGKYKLTISEANGGGSHDEWFSIQ
jgi:hypothetical protein